MAPFVLNLVYIIMYVKNIMHFMIICVHLWNSVLLYLIIDTIIILCIIFTNKVLYCYAHRYHKLNVLVNVLTVINIQYKIGQVF